MLFCKKCRKEHDGTYGSKYGSGKYCSSKCAHSRERTVEIKNKVSETLKSKKLKHPDVEKTCEYCKKPFAVEYRRRKSKKYCSKECLRKFRVAFMATGHSRKMGLASAKVSYRRSKNEIMFSEMCLTEFGTENVISNEPMFNGWDADVILMKEKVAVLWNGVWHYKKIKEGHSVLQVKNRDSIKLKEIRNAGYVPYVIRDNGRHKPRFVREEFGKLMEFLKRK